MHYHLEIIMPPTSDIDAAVTKIMAPFDENGDEKDEDFSRRNAFWDFWVVGGRWSGQKVLAVFGEDRIEAFNAVLDKRHVTISGIRFGKPTLKPESQQAMVDALWAEMFPDAPMTQCPLFDHAKGESGDVMLLRDTPRMMKCEHVIVAGPNYTGEKIETLHMLRGSIWNGVTHQETAWDKTIHGALAEFSERLASYKFEYAQTRSPTDDWISVTVDYHS